MRILNKLSHVTLYENKYGVHINLSEVNKEILDELNIYIKYVNTQEITLNKVEKQNDVVIDPDNKFKLLSYYLHLENILSTF